MNITIISGSHRIDSQSLKVGKYLQNRLIELGISNTVNIIDLADNNIPFWDEGVWKSEKRWEKIWSPIENQLAKSKAFIIVTPDWAGMVPAKLKNFFLLCTSKELGHKPALICSVSSGRGGSYPITELRSSSYKNTKICYLPEHLIIQNCEGILNTSSISTKEESYIRSRIDFALNILNQYGEAFQSICIDDNRFPYGM